jgi:hypothetical protein
MTSDLIEIEKLWNDLRNLPKFKIEDYEDKNWCEDSFSEDEYFAYILTWAGWNLPRQNREWKRVKEALDKCGGNLLGIIDPQNVHYSLPWQNKWFTGLVEHLKSENITAKELVTQLKTMEYEKAKNKLQGIVKTESDKIVECWIRDILRIDAFPINTKVRNVLKKYDLPQDPSIIMGWCKRRGINSIIFARAIYDNADCLTKR